LLRVMEISEREEEWIRFPYLTGPCRSMMEDIAKCINRHLGPLLCQTKTPPDVTHFTSPRGNAEGSFILRSGANLSQVKFVLGSWIHCRLGVGILNAATLIVMLGPENDVPHFMFEVIENDSSNLILLLDLLPRKDLVCSPDYLKIYYEDSELEKYRQVVEKAYHSQSYVPSSLYVRSAVSPTALLFKFRDLLAPNDLNLLVEDLIHPTAKNIFGTWFQAFSQIGATRPKAEGGEQSVILERDEQIRRMGIERDLSSNLPKLFGQEIADRVIASIRK
ncbi:hypothetical protein KI387_035971, partial [Taxus chinensis]